MAEDFDSSWKITGTATTLPYLGAKVVVGGGHLILRFFDPYTNKNYKGTYYGGGAGFSSGPKWAQGHDKWAKGLEYLEQYFKGQRAALSGYISNHTDTDIFLSPIAPIPFSRLSNADDFKHGLVMLTGSLEYVMNINYNVLYFHIYPHTFRDVIHPENWITGIALTAGLAIGMVGAQITATEFKCIEFVSI